MKHLHPIRSVCLQCIGTLVVSELMHSYCVNQCTSMCSQHVGQRQGAKKTNFWVYPLGMYYLKVVLTSPKYFISYSTCVKLNVLKNFPRNFTCPLGKWRTESTSLTTKSTVPRLSDMTFFAHCKMPVVYLQHVFIDQHLGSTAEHLPTDTSIIWTSLYNRVFS